MAIAWAVDFENLVECMLIENAAKAATLAFFSLISAPDDTKYLDHETARLYSPRESFLSDFPIIPCKDSDSGKKKVDHTFSQSTSIFSTFLNLHTPTARIRISPFYTDSRIISESHKTQLPFSPHLNWVNQLRSLSV